MRNPVDRFRGLRYLLEPDYSKQLPALDAKFAFRMLARLRALYGLERAPEVLAEIERVLKVHHAYCPPELVEAENNVVAEQRFSERDVVLITYGDLLVSENRTPLRTLADFTEVFFRGVITTLHILPFYPYSSDRGFSVISYHDVDPKLGSWDEIAELERTFKLMFDGVFNHSSSKSVWFRQYLAGDPEFRDFFVGFSSRRALSEEHRRLIMRPRTSELLTEYATIWGPKYVWTTFSPDQVDLNFQNPRVLIKILETLLYYVRRGADLIRLDAVTYLWCEFGTSCAHLEETHQLVRLFRAVLDVAAPHVALVTETNVPHQDNLTYFGNGSDEAQMIYNFALPPLVLHAFLCADATRLSEWAKTLDTPSRSTAFFNFLDSHDGIGLLGAKGILSEQEIDYMCAAVRERGGLVSERTVADGTTSPYELNITWFSALNGGGETEPVDRQVDRFIASRAIALALKGVPGIYLPSFFGSRNDLEAVLRDGLKRSIKRATIVEEKLFEALSDPESVPARVATRFVDLLEYRVASPAFHPTSNQKILDVDHRVFGVLRSPESCACSVLCLVNVSAEALQVKMPEMVVQQLGEFVHELLTGNELATRELMRGVALSPYQVCWYASGT
jgi:sucrose phosphorylase